MTANDDKCWLWMRGTSARGYGVIGKKGGERYSHRLAWALVNGRMPTLNILHSCDNPPCCNPKHLREGTQKDNGQDAANRKRFSHRIGEKTSSAKLTELDVCEIRLMFEREVPTGKIREKFPLSYTALYDIRDRKSWSHVE